MFTGIIEQTGTLVGLESRGGVRRITVEAPGLAGRLREGDSLGVSGVCLTALDVDPTLFHADLAQETLDRTSLGALAAGAKVNLELPTAAGSPLGGHIVQGHVDGCGAMTALDPVISRGQPGIRPADHRLDAQGARPGKRPAVDGAQGLGGRGRHQPDDCRLRRRDNHHCDSCRSPIGGQICTRSRVGAPVNVEADVLVKLAHAQMLTEKKPELELTEAWLVANGY